MGVLRCDYHKNFPTPLPQKSNHPHLVPRGVDISKHALCMCVCLYLDVYVSYRAGGSVPFHNPPVTKGKFTRIIVYKDQIRPYKKNQAISTNTRSGLQNQIRPSLTPLLTGSDKANVRTVRFLGVNEKLPMYIHINFTINTQSVQVNIETVKKMLSKP